MRIGRPGSIRDALQPEGHKQADVFATESSPELHPQPQLVPLADIDGVPRSPLGSLLDRTCGEKRVRDAAELAAKRSADRNAEVVACCRSVENDIAARRRSGLSESEAWSAYFSALSLVQDYNERRVPTGEIVVRAKLAMKMPGRARALPLILEHAEARWLRELEEENTTEDAPSHSVWVDRELKSIGVQKRMGHEMLTQFAALERVIDRGWACGSRNWATPSTVSSKTMGLLRNARSRSHRRAPSSRKAISSSSDDPGGAESEPPGQRGCGGACHLVKKSLHRCFRPRRVHGGTK